MTGEELRAQFTLLREVASGPVTSHYARDGSGRFVMIHLTAGLSPADRSALVSSLDRLPAGDRRRVLSRLEVEGAPAIITEYLQGFTTFPAWLETRAAPAAGPVPIDPAPQAPPAAGPRKPPAGEFTQMFGPVAAESAPHQKPVTPPAPPAAVDSEATVVVPASLG
jgi:hypothetical protein